MSILGFWCIIFSAVVMAQICGAAIGTLITSTKWYKKWVTKMSIEWTSDFMANYNETEEKTEKIDTDWMIK